MLRSITCENKDTVISVGPIKNIAMEKSMEGSVDVHVETDAVLIVYNIPKHLRATLGQNTTEAPKPTTTTHLNLNDEVKFRITEKGMAYLRKRPETYASVSKDAEGY